MFHLENFKYADTNSAQAFVQSWCDAVASPFYVLFVHSGANVDGVCAKPTTPCG
jgi:hypothetical protein